MTLPVCMNHTIKELAERTSEPEDRIIRIVLSQREDNNPSIFNKEKCFICEKEDATFEIANVRVSLLMTKDLVGKGDE